MVTIKELKKELEKLDENFIIESIETLGKAIFLENLKFSEPKISIGTCLKDGVPYGYAIRFQNYYE